MRQKVSAGIVGSVLNSALEYLVDRGDIEVITACESSTRYKFPCPELQEFYVRCGRRRFKVTVMESTKTLGLKNETTQGKAQPLRIRVTNGKDLLGETTKN